MADIKLTAKKRETKIPGKILRSKNILPAVLYGRKTKNKVISLDQKEFTKTFKEAGTSSLIDLKIEKSKPLKVIIHDLQFDPVSDQIIHVDFYQIREDEKIKTEIPLEATGTSPAVEDEGGNLIFDKDEIEVECLPDKLIDKLQVDISSLESFDDVIRIEDLEVPKGIDVLEEKNEVVATVTPPRSEEELEELEEAPTASDVDDVEVEKEKEEEIEEGEEAPEEAEAKEESENKEEK